MAFIVAILVQNYMPELSSTDNSPIKTHKWGRRLCLSQLVKNNRQIYSLMGN